jgi:hypothetical protein
MQSMVNAKSWKTCRSAVDGLFATGPVPTLGWNAVGFAARRQPTDNASTASQQLFRSGKRAASSPQHRLMMPFAWIEPPAIDRLGRAISTTTGL